MDIEKAKILIKKDIEKFSVSEKVSRYIGKFFDCEIKNDKIIGYVDGNHGEYTVSIQVRGQHLEEHCSCYIGKDGCHHTLALEHTFLKHPEDFEIIKEVKRARLNSIEKIRDYLDYVTLEELTAEMNALGLTQQDLANATGTSPAHISAVKRSEARNRYFKELGAIKMACLWMIDNAKKIKKPDKTKKKSK
jgi:uncharacterized Zn finger protein